MLALIERLRGGVFGLNRIALCAEAADEIERLQKELQRQALDYLALDTQAAQLAAERDALLKAMHEALPFCMVPAMETLQAAIDAARKA